MLVIKNCNIINQVEEKILFNKDVFINNEFIEKIRSSGNDSYQGYLEIDGKNKYLIPGLIDAHVHLTMYATPDNIRNFLMDTPSFTVMKAYNNALKCLEGGFTTIRTMGEKSSVDIGIKQAINDGLFLGPRILASGKALTITGGHGDLYPGEITLDSIGETVNGVEEVRKVSRDRLKYNCDNIKVMATGGGNSAGPGDVSELSEEEMRAAVTEANRRNKTTAAHAIGADGIKNALRAGIRTIEHGTFLDDEGIELLLEKDAYLVPTLCAFRTIKYGPEGGVPEYVLKKIHYFATEHYRNLEKAIKAGVKVVCGTDTGTPFNYHGDGAEELYLYTQHGMTPMESLRSATTLAAEALKLENIGLIEEGYIADLLLLSQNPIDDMSIFIDKSIFEKIIVRGKIYK